MLIMGFVFSGDNKSLLVRGVGPALASFGVSSALADPRLMLFGPNGMIAANDDWQIDSGGQPNGQFIAASAAQAGAFALSNGSKDSALVFTINRSAYTTGLTGSNGATGVALMEIYDTDHELGSRLINGSARMNLTPDGGPLIAGFVIAGNAPITMLLRGVGPTLSTFAVTGALADPKISVFSGSTQVASNDNWETGASTASQLVSTSAQVGAFALPASSKDAVLLLKLQPGPTR